MSARRYTSDRHRVEANISKDPATGCWVWQGETQARGYGRVFLGRKASPKYAMAHRFSYEVFVGAIGEGLVIDHLCRNKLCVNPEHLQPVSPRVNVLRAPETPAAVNAAKTHCPRDHELVPVKGGTASNGARRICLICRRARWRAWDARRKASLRQGLSA